MLHRIVADFIGRYLENDSSAEASRLSLRQGTCTLHHCKLRKEIVETLPVPFDLKQVTFDKLHLKVQWNGWFERASVKVFITNAKVDIEQFGSDDKDNAWDAERAEERVRVVKRHLVAAGLRRSYRAEDREGGGQDVLLRRSWGREGCCACLGLYKRGEPCKATLRVRRIYISANDVPDVGVARIHKCFGVEECSLGFEAKGVDKWEEEEELVFCEEVNGWLDIGGGGDDVIRVGANVATVDVRLACAKRLLVLQSAARSVSRFQEFVVAQSALQRSRRASDGQRLYTIATHILQTNARKRRLNALSSDHFAELQSLYLTCLERKGNGRIAPMLREWLDEFELYCPVGVLVALCNTKRFYALRDQGGSGGWRERAYALMLQEDQTVLREAKVSPVLQREGSQAEGFLEFSDIKLQVPAPSKGGPILVRLAGRCTVRANMQLEITHVSIGSSMNDTLFKATPQTPEKEPVDDVFFDAAEEAGVDDGEEEGVEGVEGDESDIQTLPSVAFVSIDTKQQRLHLKLESCELLVSTALYADVLHAFGSQHSSSAWSIDVSGTDLLLGIAASSGNVGPLLSVDHLVLESNRLVLRRTGVLIREDNDPSSATFVFNGVGLASSKVFTVEEVSIGKDEAGRVGIDLVQTIASTLSSTTLNSLMKELTILNTSLRSTGFETPSTRTTMRIRMDLLRGFGTEIAGALAEVLPDGSFTLSIQEISGHVRAQRTPGAATEIPVVSIEHKEELVNVIFGVGVEVDVTRQFGALLRGQDTGMSIVKELCVQCPSARFLWADDHVLLQVNDIRLQHKIGVSCPGLHIGSMAVIDLTTNEAAAGVEEVDINNDVYEVEVASLTHSKAIDFVCILQKTIADIPSTTFTLCIQTVKVNLPILRLQANRVTIQPRPATSNHAYELALSDPHLVATLHPLAITCTKGDVHVVADLDQRDIHVRLPSVEVKVDHGREEYVQPATGTTAVALPEVNVVVHIDAAAIVFPDRHYRSSTAQCTVVLTQEEGETMLIAEAKDVGLEVKDVDGGAWEHLVKEAQANLRVALRSEEGAVVFADEVDVNIERLRLTLPQHVSMMNAPGQSSSSEGFGELAAMFAKTRLSLEVNGGEINLPLTSATHASILFTAHGNALHKDDEMQASLSVSTSIVLVSDHEPRSPPKDEEVTVGNDESLRAAVERAAGSISLSLSEEVVMDWSEFIVESSIHLYDPSRVKVFTISMTSDTHLHVTPEDITLLYRAVQAIESFSYPAAHSVLSKPLDSTNHYAVTFADETLGLKLGPCMTPPFALEVRGYSKGCPETKSHRIAIGDRIAQVNETSLAGLSATEAAEAIRKSQRPCVLTFATRAAETPAAIASIEQYLPVHADAYICEFCGAVVGLNEDGLDAAGTGDTCCLCGGKHTSVGVGEDARSMVKEEEAVENQRFYRMSGWSQEVLPSDGFSWSNRERTKPTPLSSFALPVSQSPGKHWTWLEEWKLDRTQGDKDGWIYGRDFNQIDSRHTLSNTVRSRRWTRRRALTTTPPAQQRGGSGGLQALFTTGRFRLGFVLSYRDKQEVIQLCRVSLAQATIRTAMFTASRRTTANVEVGVEMRNGRAGKWEPVLEPWEVAIEGTEVGGSSAVTLLGMNSVFVNVSADLVLSVERFICVLNREADPCIMYPVVVVNSTGCLMSVWKERSDSPVVELQPKAQRWLSDVADVKAFDSPVVALGIELFGGWKPIRSLPIGSVGTWALALPSRSPASVQRRTVFVEVTSQQSRRSVAVVAPYSLRNLTAVPINCIVATQSGSTILIGPIAYAQSAPIPFDITDVRSITVSRADGHHQQHEDEEQDGLCTMNLEEVKAAVEEQLTEEHEATLEQSQYEEAVSGEKVLTSVHAHAVEHCYLAEQLLPTVSDERLKTRRAILGQPFSAKLLTLSFHAPLSFTNHLHLHLDIQLQAADSAFNGHGRIVSNETWSLLAQGSCSPQTRFRLRCDALSAVWSEWYTVVDRPQCVYLYDGRKRRVCISVKWQALHEDRVVAGSFACGTWVLNSTSLPIEFGVVRKEHTRETGSTGFEQLPSLFEMSADDVQQSERWTPLGGWGAPSLPRDPPEWVLLGLGSVQAIKSLETLVAAKGWSYVDKTWLADDWAYAVDFTSAEWGRQQRSFHCVRKRRWTRVAQREMRLDYNQTPLGDDVVAFKIRIGTSAWSKDVEVSKDTVGRDVEVNFGSGMVLLHVEYRQPMDKYMPLLVDIRPRFALENNTVHSLALHQHGDVHKEDTNPLPPSGQVGCWIWSTQAATQMLCIAVGDCKSGPLDLCLLDTVPVTLRDANGRIRELLRLRTERGTTGALTRVAITAEEFPGSILVENRTEAEVVVTQKIHVRWGLKHPGLVVKGLRAVPLGWDCVARDSPPAVIVRLSNGEFLTVDINRSTAGVVASSQDVDVVVYSKGSDASYVICLVAKGRLVRGLRANQSRPHFQLRLELPHICVSVIDGTPLPAEQLLLHFANVQFSRRLDDVVDQMALAIEGVQVDDAVRRTRWPVVVKVSSDDASKRGCVVDVVADRLVRGGSSSFVRFRSLSILVEQAIVRMTRHLFQYLQGLGRRCLDLFSGWETAYDISVDALHIQPLTVVLTLSSNETLRLVRDSRGFAEEALENVQAEVSIQSVAESAMLRVMSSGELPYWASALEHLLGTDVVDKVVEIPAMFAVNLSTTSTASWQSVYTHYREAFVAGLALGSFKRQPTEFTTGFMNLKGTIHSISGTSETITKSLARALTAFSLSNEYITKRQQSEEQVANRYNSLHESVAHGAAMLSEGIGDAVKGIVLDPYHGAQSGGAMGFVEGIGRGVLGVAVKPAVGMLDLAANTAKGFKDQATPKQTRDASILTSLYPEATRILQLEEGQDPLVRPARPFYGRSRQVKAYRLEDALICHFLENTGIMEATEAFYGAFVSKATQRPNQHNGRGKVEEGRDSVYVATSTRVLMFGRDQVKLHLPGDANELFRLDHIVTCRIQRSTTNAVGVQVEHSKDGPEKEHTFMRCSNEKEASCLLALLHEILLYNY